MKSIIISQYKAALKMLTDVIIKCPDDLWLDDNYENAYWRIVYHCLFYAAFYLAENDMAFVPWPKHVEYYNYLGTLNTDGVAIVIDEAYSKADMLDYAEKIAGQVTGAMAFVSEDKESGFYWLSISKLELQLYSIRHIQHHIGQLVERLHRAGIKGINWVGMG